MCTGRRKAAEGGLSARACGARRRGARVDFAIRRWLSRLTCRRNPCDSSFWNEAARVPHVAILSETTAGRCHHGRRSTSASKVEASRTHVVNFTCAPVHPGRCAGAFSCVAGRRLFESHRNRVGFVGAARETALGRRGKALDSGEPALDPLPSAREIASLSLNEEESGHKNNV